MTALAMNLPAAWPMQSSGAWGSSETVPAPGVDRSSTETLLESKLSEGSDGLWEVDDAHTSDVTAANDLTHRRLQQQRDRNRQAQNRYRQKCRAKKKEVISRHGQTVVELQAARAENAMLTQQSTLLDSILVVRDWQIDILKESKTQQLFDPRPCWATLEPGLTPGQHAVIHCYCSSNQECKHVPGEQGIPLETHAERAAFVAQGATALSQQFEVTMGRLAELVAEIESGPPSRALQEALREEMMNGRTLCWRVGHYMAGRHAEIAGIAQGAHLMPGHWDEVVRALELTPRQGERMFALGARLRAELLGIQSERRSHVAGIDYFGRKNHGVTKDRREPQSGDLTVTLDMMGNAMRVLQAQEAAWALEDLFAQEQRVYGAIAHGFFEMLDCLQCAKLFVYSRPFLPDLACLVEAWERQAIPRVQQ